MYRVKQHLECEMPKEGTPLSCVVLNGSLKHAPDISNTEELAQLVLDAMQPHKVASEVIRLADKSIPVGLAFRESENDEWPEIVEKIKAADIVIFATPVWWGNRSSLMQRVIERLDALDEEYIATGRSALLNKVAGVVITGSEDGAQATLGGIMEVLTFMNFTLPPGCAAYWVGEVGQDPKEDRARRLKNEAAKHMAKNLARNLVFYAQLLKMHPMVPKE
jgi:multimeric flavodoxin WrbA